MMGSSSNNVFRRVASLDESVRGELCSTLLLVMARSAQLPLFSGEGIGRPSAEFGLHLFEPRYVDMAKEAMAKSNGRFGCVYLFCVGWLVV
jgi:hypothetical protein